MNKRSWIVLLGCTLLVLALAGCQRPASRAPIPAVTSDADFPFPLPAADENTVKNIISGTQTAIAMGVQPMTGSGTAVEIVLPTQTPPVVVPPAETPAPAVPSPTPLPPAVWVATPGLPTVYTLQAGEFPFCIARRFNLDLDELLTLNGLTLSSLPSAGSEIKIPNNGKSWGLGDRALRAHPTTYTLQNESTVYEVACLFGDVDPNGLIEVNRLESPYILSAGQVIQVP